MADHVWQAADLLRRQGDPASAELILPLTLLRRLDCVLAPTKDAVLREYERIGNDRVASNELDARLNQIAGFSYHNHSRFDLRQVAADARDVDTGLLDYVDGFSLNVRRILGFYDFESQVERMHVDGILRRTLSRFAQLDLGADAVSDEQLAEVFDDLIRRTSDLARGGGEHFTPRDVIRLMTALLFAPDGRLLRQANRVRTLLDPACGTGGMLTQAERYLREAHTAGRLDAYGQERNEHAFAVATTAAFIDEEADASAGWRVRLGDSLADDKFQGYKFDYFLSDPPFGTPWKAQQKAVEAEHRELGFDGRFGAGLPRIGDSSLLFLQHMWSKRAEPGMPGTDGGSRLAVTFLGSPMFVGGAGSGESEIRRWLLENDWLEAIVALPESLFYNTSIGAYVWLLSNRKVPRRAGKVQLIDARDIWSEGADDDGPRLVGSRRRHLTAGQVDEITRLYDAFGENSRSKIVDNSDFGYTRITIEYALRLRYQMTAEGKGRFLNAYPELLDDVQAIEKVLGREPLLDWTAVAHEIDEVLDERRSRWGGRERRDFELVFTETDPAACPVLDDRTRDGYLPDPALREFDSVPLSETPEEFFDREIRPFRPDAWLNHEKDRIGYEIRFEQYFRAFTPPRPITEIDADLLKTEKEILRLLRGTAS